MSSSSLAHESWSRGSIEARQRHVVWNWFIHYHFLPLKMSWPLHPSKKVLDIDLDGCIKLWASWPSSGFGLSECRNMGEGEGALQYGGRITYLSRGPCWRAFDLFEVFSPSCIIFWQSPPVRTKCYTLIFSWWKGIKALRICKNTKNIESV